MLQRENPSSTIKNLVDAFWFSLTTITTTGYGDVYPATIEGKIIATILIFVGMAVILGFIASYGSTTVEARLKRGEIKLENQTKAIIKEKIDYIENLNNEDVSTLIAMITTLHGTLQKKLSGQLLSSCSECGNVYPHGSKFCNNCSF